MYTKIYDRIWSMLKRKGVSSNGKTLYIYLFSCSHRTLLGIYKLPLSYIAEDLEFSMQTVNKLITELKSKQLIEYDTANSCVFVKKFLECNEIPNRNVEKKAAKLAASDLPSTPLVSDFLLEVSGCKDKLPNLFETVLKRYCEQFNKPYAEQYAIWYGNTEAEYRSRIQNTEAEAEERSGSPAGAGSAAAGESDFLDALNYYHKNISPSMPTACKVLFRDYVGDLSAPVVKLVIDKAVKAGVTTWAYIAPILNDCREKRIHTADAFQADQDRFRASKAGPYAPGGGAVTEQQRNKQISDDVARMRRLVEEIKANEEAEMQEKPEATP